MRAGAKTAFTAPGSPWKNGYCESFNSRFRDVLRNGEVFYTLREAQTRIAGGAGQPAPRYRPAAPESRTPMDQRLTMH